MAARRAGSLRIVFGVNAGMFLAEFAAGLLIGSTALLGDSLDMLGDALVYGFSLYALGRSLRWRNGAAQLKGLGMGGFGLAVRPWASASSVVQRPLGHGRSDS